MAEDRWFTSLDPEERMTAGKGFRGLYKHHKTILPLIGKHLPQAKEMYNHQLAAFGLLWRTQFEKSRSGKYVVCITGPTAINWKVFFHFAIEILAQEWPTCFIMLELQRLKHK